jgi:hypothetical protein
MDPYLEDRSLWPGTHHRLISTICEQLQPLINPRYIAEIEQYTALELIDIVPTRLIAPDVAVIERTGASPGMGAAVIDPPPVVGAVELSVPTRYGRIEIRTTRDESIVTVIEVLSPVNKRPGSEAADAYERKRQELFRTDAHLLEIDLLRSGRRPALATPWPEAMYAILLSRAEQRPSIGIWPLGLVDTLPVVSVPLRYPDPDVALDLGAVLRQVYASGRYDLRLDYRQPPPQPELSLDEASWLDRLLRERGLR